MSHIFLLVIFISDCQLLYIHLNCIYIKLNLSQYYKTFFSFQQKYQQQFVCSLFIEKNKKNYNYYYIFKFYKSIYYFYCYS